VFLEREVESRIRDTAIVDVEHEERCMNACASAPAPDFGDACPEVRLRGLS
jgi:hypothetical protein